MVGVTEQRAPHARAVWLGRRAYEPIHALQKRLVEARARQEIGDVVLLVEHEPVITLGRGADPANVLFPAEALAARGVSRVETGRGGDVTYHGPGQLVVYPILDLNHYHLGLHAYMRLLEQSIIDTIAKWGITGERDPAATAYI